MRTFSSDDDVSFLQNKLPILYFIVLSFILIVLGRLYYLQVYRGGTYRSLSEQISVRLEELRAPRGHILDRNGKVLAAERPYFEIQVTPQYLTNRERTFESLTQLIPITREEIEESLFENRYLAPFFPVVLVEDAPLDWISKIRQYQRPDYDDDTPFFLEGVTVRKSSLREYYYPELFSHALGYLNEIDKSTLEKFRKKYPGRYSQGDLMGMNGVEGAYDLALRGFDGVRARVVDARGREVRGDVDLDLLQERASEAPIDGQTLMTTLDYDSQVAASEAMGERLGGVVALDPNTGEVIVLYSSPGYNANRIIKNVDKDYWKMINLHEDKFLYSRAVQAAYPPGSIYKLVDMFAGLDTGKVPPEKSFFCGGGMRFGSRFFKCWKSGGHGRVSMFRGIAQSCDVYFYNVGLIVGVDGLHEYAHRFGLGERTGIEIAYENPGLIPSTQWKKKRYGQEWIESETLSIAIGQGYDLITPIQAAKMNHPFL